MVCPRCGNANPEVAQFCGKCGTALSSRPQPADPPVPKSGVSSKMKVGMIIASIVIPVVGVIMGIVYMNSPDPDRKAAGRTWLLIGVVAFVIYCILSGALNNLMQGNT